MTVSTTGQRFSYAGDGSTVAFPFPRRFLNNEDLRVVLLDEGGVETVLTLTSDFSVSGAGEDAGGAVTMNTPPISGETLIIMRRTDLKQNTDYATGGAFSAEGHEDALDKLTLIAQDLQEQVDRAPKLRESSSSNAPAVPEPSALKAIRWNSAGIALENVDLPTWITGVGAPMSGAGIDGDMYFRTDTGEVYGPKASGSWSSATADLSGPAGPAGEDGQNGDVTTTGSVTSGNLVEYATGVGNEIQDSGLDPNDVLVGADIGTTVQGYDADTAKTDVEQVWTAAQRETAVAMTDSGGEFAVDLSLGNYFRANDMNGNHSLSNPTNRPPSGDVQLVCFEMVQDAAGSRVPTFDTDYVGANGGSVEAISDTTADTYSIYVGVVCNTGMIPLALVMQGVAQ